MVAVLATVGLVISLTALWPRLGPGSTDRDPEPGPPVSAAAPQASGTATASREGQPGASPGVPAGAEVGRSDAGLPEAVDPAASRPAQVTLASVGVVAPVRPVGVAEDRQMQLPPDPRVLGWYRFGPEPGTGQGSVVVAGHLDSRRLGLGPLVRLRDLEAGDAVEVATTDGTVISYVVQDLRRYDRQALPATLFARTGPERLRVVTCGGAYDAEAGGYQQNLVVTAVPR